MKALGLEASRGLHHEVNIKRQTQKRPIGSAPTHSQTPSFALISDTHNFLRPAEPAFLAEGDHTAHGGDIAKLNLAAAGAKVRAMVSGHSHKPSMVERDRVLFINPGIAGPRRLKLPISLGELLIDSDRRMTPRMVTLV